MMRHLIGMACLTLTALVGSAFADERPLVVLELYTSQGCSSCPPADALLKELSQEEDVLALSFHVDYWDYIGWADTFADRHNDKRQKTYAHGFGERMVYTPQMIIQGTGSIVGHKEEKIRNAIADTLAKPVTVQVDLSRKDDMLTISLRPLGAAVGETELTLVRFNPKANVQIRRGENAGRDLAYANVVMEWHIAGVWPGNAPETVVVPVTGDLPMAVLVQSRGQGEVLAAARLP